MAAQLIQRRVYDDKDNLLREGLVPKDVPNTRKDLMAWWQQEDQRIAAEEAAAAEKAAAELAAPAAPDPAELIAPVADGLAALEPRVAELEALRLATPEAVLAGTLAIQRAAGAAALVEAAGQTVIAQVDAAAAAADARLGEIEGQVGAAADAVGQLLADGRSQLEQTSAEMLSKATSAISKRITQFQVEAAQLRGPKGNTGRIGQGLIAGAGQRPALRPDGSDWAPGDSWLDTKSEGFQLSYMAADGSWSKPARLVPAPQLVNAQQNVLDMAPRSTVIQNIAASGGSGTGGAPLLSNRATLLNSVTVADSSNFAGTNSDPTSGQLVLEFMALDGSLSGRKGYLVADFLYEPTGDKNTQYSLLGELRDVVDVEITVLRQGASVPSGITASVPGGSQCTRVQIRLLPPAGGSMPDGTQYRLSGDVTWAHQSLGRAGAINAAGITPLWNWI